MPNGTIQNYINSYTLIEHTPDILDLIEQVAVERQLMMVPASP